MKTTIILVIIQIFQIRLGKGGVKLSKIYKLSKNPSDQFETYKLENNNDCEYIRDKKFELFTNNSGTYIEKLVYLRNEYPFHLYALLTLTSSYDPLYLDSKQRDNIHNVCEGNWMQLKNLETCGLAVLQYRASPPVTNTHQQNETSSGSVEIKSDDTVQITLTVAHLDRKSEPFDIILESQFKELSVCFDELRDQSVIFDVPNIFGERYDGEVVMMFLGNKSLDIPLPMLRIYKEKNSNYDWKSFINTQTILQVSKPKNFEALHQRPAFNRMTNFSLVEMQNKKISLKSIVTQLWLTGFILHDIKKQKTAEAIETRLKKLETKTNVALVLCRTPRYSYDVSSEFEVLPSLTNGYLFPSNAYIPKQFLVISDSPSGIYDSSFVYISPKMFNDLYKFKKELSVTIETSNIEQKQSQEEGYDRYMRLEPSLNNEPFDLSEPGAQNLYLNTEESESYSFEEEEEEEQGEQEEEQKEEQEEKRDSAFLMLHTGDKKNELNTVRSLEVPGKKYSKIPKRITTIL